MAVRTAALLRGINVGGHRKLPMAGLRALLEGLGATEVVTHLQSGNAVFRHADGARPELARRIERSIAAAFGFEVPVLLRDAKALRRVVAQNPFPTLTETPTLLHVAFFSGPIAARALPEEDLERFAPDRAVVDGAHVYLCYPNGAGRTKLTNDFLERKTGLVGTARNWNTVLALLGLLEG